MRLYNKTRLIKIVSKAVSVSLTLLMMFSAGAVHAKDLPAKYDLREAGYLTPVRNQGTTGTCWVHGTFASLESYMVKKGYAKKDVDFSELAMAYYTYSTELPNYKSLIKVADKYAGADRWQTLNLGNAYDTGGYTMTASATGARGFGLMDTKTAKKYRKPDGTYSIKGINKSTYRVRDVDIYPETAGRDDEGYYLSVNKSAVDAIKSGIMRDGAMLVSYASGSDSYALVDSLDEKSHYTFDRYDYADHMVSVVGWDDNYPRENFDNGTDDARIPPKDGAWIIKNSWGKAFGESGFLYISYYDRAFTEVAKVKGERIKYKNGNKNHEYGRLYQYDGIGLGSDRFTSDEEYLQANIFKMAGNHKLAAVSFFNDKADAKVSVDIYKNPKDGEPTSGKKIASLSFTQKLPGYHTKDLMKKVNVKKGDVISVVISSQYTKDGNTQWEILQEHGFYNHSANGSAIIDCRPGQTYVKSGENGQWKDAVNLPKLTKDQTFQKGSSLGNATVKLLTAR